MPQFFIGDTFGLNTVYDRQVLNVEQRNFLNWTESATYGYYAGGSASTTTDSTTINRIDFFNEVVSLPGKNLPSGLGGVGAVYNVSYGYFGGGDNPTPTVVNTITRLDLSTESISVPGKNLPGSRTSTGCVSSSFYGYFGGGYTGSVRVNSILRLDFSSETLSALTNNLTQLKNTLCGVSNLSYGYFCGGLTPPPVALGRSSVVDRLDFTTETTTAPTTLRLSSERSQIMPSFNSYYGYISGGQLPASRVSIIDRLDFTAEFTTQLGTTLPQIRSGGSGTSSISYGYYAGGILGAPPTLTRASLIDRLDFSTETSTSTALNLTQARTSIAHFSSGQSIYRGSKTYGYYGGGPAPLSVIKLDFSTENVSSTSGSLDAQRLRLSATSSNFYGYFGGGDGPPTVPFPYVSSIARLDFSNETVSDPGKNLTMLPGVYWNSTVSSSSYGYFVGGLVAPTDGVDCKIRRLDFSNETVSDPGQNLPMALYGIAGTSSSSYGYFGGGGTTITVNTITRLDFSNDTLSPPGKNLPAVRNTATSVSNNFYGYIGGGTGVCTITRLDFSNETVSDPGKNLSTPRGAASATSSSSYGYFGGGLNPGITCVISRLDFSSETVSDPGKNLPTNRPRSAAVSNSN